MTTGIEYSCDAVLCDVDRVGRRTRVQNLCLNHGVEVAPRDSTTAKKEALYNARRNRGVSTHGNIKGTCHLSLKGRHVSLLFSNNNGRQQNCVTKHSPIVISTH